MEFSKLVFSFNIFRFGFGSGYGSVEQFMDPDQARCCGSFVSGSGSGIMLRILRNPDPQH